MEEAMTNTRVSTILACCLALTIGAATKAAPQANDHPSQERGDLDVIRKISTLIGTHVLDRTNTKVAALRDLALSPGGEVLYAVLGRGGVGGIGETDIGIPFNVLEMVQADGKWNVHLDTSVYDLNKAPTIQSANYRELTDPQWVARVNQFFHRRGELKGRQGETTATANSEDRSVGSVLLATKICNARIKNSQSEDLGKVEDLLLDRTYRVTFMIAATGGVLGVGERYIPVPWSQLGLSTNPENAAVAVSLDVTKAQLEKAPLIKGDNFATLLAPGFADEVRHYFAAIGHGASTRAEKSSR
jgi:hypothetical protein